jgi:hypothetical protein
MITRNIGTAILIIIGCLTIQLIVPLIVEKFEDNSDERTNEKSTELPTYRR